MGQIDSSSEVVTKAELAEFYQKILPYLNGESKVNYSTDEQEIGTWIDGSKLYQKVIPFTTPENESADGVVTTISSDLKIVEFNGFTQYSSKNENIAPLFCFLASSSTSCSVYKRGDKILCQVKGSHMTKQSAWLIIRYTKE